VKPECVDRFIDIYGADGRWAALFRKHPGYEGTTLLRDVGSELRFLTIDRWDSDGDFERMRQASAVEYSALDEECASLAVSEKRLGTFRRVEGAALEL
jgi:antibiotic biosynthesis monooxygenase